MKNNSKSSQNSVLFESRELKLVTCPHCWTDQRTERDSCYRCGAGFTYFDELEIRKMDPSRWYPCFS